jgi:hypothetical protein
MVKNEARKTNHPLKYDVGFPFLDFFGEKKAEPG